MIYTAFQDRLDAIPRPDSTKIKESVFKEMDSFVGTKKQIEDREDELKILVDAEMKNARNEYSEKHKAVLAGFRKALAEHYGFGNAEVDVKVYDKAYENACSNGLSGIEEEYEDLMEMAEQIFKIGQRTT